MGDNTKFFIICLCCFTLFVNLYPESVLEYRCEKDADSKNSTAEENNLKIVYNDKLIKVILPQGKSYFIDQSALYLTVSESDSEFLRQYLNTLNNPEQIPCYQFIININKSIQDEILKNGKPVEGYIDFIFNSSPPNIKTAVRSQTLKLRIFKDETGFVNKIERYISTPSAAKDKPVSKTTITKNGSGRSSMISTETASAQSQLKPVQFTLITAPDQQESISLPEKSLMQDAILLDEKNYKDNIRNKKDTLSSIYNLGRLYRSRKMTAEALLNLNQAWMMKPGSPMIADEIIQTYVFSNDNQSAKKFIKDNERFLSAQSYLLASRLFGMMHDPVFEHESLRNALKVSRNSKEKIFSLVATGNMFRKRKSFTLAMKSYNDAMKLTEKDDKNLHIVIRNEIAKTEKLRDEFNTERKQVLDNGHEKIINALREKGNNELADKMEKKFNNNNSNKNDEKECVVGHFKSL